MKIALVQINPVIADLQSNFERMKHHFETCSLEDVSLVIFSECVLTGYPPQDLLSRHDFIDSIHHYINKIKLMTKSFPDSAICFGTPFFEFGTLFNAACVIHNGDLIFKQDKINLPNYDIFDEKRYFSSGTKQDIFCFKGYRIGITICEDAWKKDYHLYNHNPIDFFCDKNIDLILNLSASPFEVSKDVIRFDLFANHAKTLDVPVVVVNQVGANDHLIFDGNSFVVSPFGDVLCQLSSFSEDVSSLSLDKPPSLDGMYHALPLTASIHDALVLGIRDYVAKTGFKNVVIGLSGGIDSAVTCALAVKALGSENVKGFSLPSQFSSEGSLIDAKSLADNLNIEYSVISIEAIYNQCLLDLAPVFNDLEPNVTEENIQARSRGILLMAIANKFNALVLATGNKSELAMGYCTLYGDMCGALSVLGDVSKTRVYELARLINQDSIIIPENSLLKPPSAELRPNQKDSDSLPAYDQLDPIINFYIEDGLDASSIIEQGYDQEMVMSVIKTIRINEYKRSQAPITLKITSQAFGNGRRFPIAMNLSY